MKYLKKRIALILAAIIFAVNINAVSFAAEGKEDAEDAEVIDVLSENFFTEEASEDAAEESEQEDAAEEPKQENDTEE